MQGDDACSRISNSQCNAETGECVCHPHFTPNSKNKACKSEFTVLINDGASLDPFTPEAGTRRQFQPREDVESDSTIGVFHNGYVLHVNGTVSTAYYCLLNKFSFLYKTELFLDL